MLPPRPPSTIAGRHACTVFQTPVKFTSSTSRHVSGDRVSGSPTLNTPALVTTTSICPNESSTRATTARTRAGSRTSPTSSTARPPSDRISSSVCLRSAGLARSYGTVAIGAHRSSPPISAPRRANSSAWDRPWPRATPVTNTTFPDHSPPSPITHHILPVAVTSTRRGGERHAQRYQALCLGDRPVVTLNGVARVQESGGDVPAHHAEANEAYGRHIASCDARGGLPAKAAVHPSPRSPAVK